MHEIYRTIEDDDVLGVSDGQVRFSSQNAVSLMLRNGVLNLSRAFELTEAGARNDDRLTVDCSDVFVWGCSDHEDLPYAAIENLYRLWRKGPGWGPAVWCMIQRREMPQEPVEDAIREEGLWDLDAVRKEHALRANSYDGTSLVRAQRQYQVYSAWEIERGRRPRSFDGWQWWEGWEEYAAEHPGWHDEAWQAEDQRLCDIWLRENRFDS